MGLEEGGRIGLVGKVQPAFEKGALVGKRSERDVGEPRIGSRRGQHLDAKQCGAVNDHSHRNVHGASIRRAFASRFIFRFWLPMRIGGSSKGSPVRLGKSSGRGAYSVMTSRSSMEASLMTSST